MAEPSQTKPRHVLMTTSVFPRWLGDATPPFVLRQAEQVAAAGWRVTVLAPHAPGAKRQERWGDVEIIRFRYLWPESLQGLFYEGGMLVQLRKHPHRKWQLPFLFIAQIWATHQLCRTKSFDVLHAHSLLPQGFTALFNGQLPVVATSHGADVLELKQGGLYGKLKRRVARQAAAITVNSSVTQAAVERLGAATEKVIRVPATPNITPPQAEKVAALKTRFVGAKLLLYVGRLIEQKGVEDVLRALALRRNVDPQLQLSIVGDGANRDRLEALTEELGLDDAVHFVGWVDGGELGNYYAAADVFIATPKPGATSVLEAQGLVYIEAMAAGTPVIASRCGGIPDAVIDGETGLLVEPGDVAGIVSALEQMFEQPALRVRLAENARRRYEMEFSPAVVTRKMLGVYQSVIKVSTTSSARRRQE